MRQRYRIGFFIGRFQPFHNGHLYALRYALSICRNLVIGIGSADKKGTENNPLSASDRMRIISSALKLEKIRRDRMTFMRVPDFEDNDEWFGYIMSRKPDIGVVFSRNRLVKSIFREHGIMVVLPRWHERRRLAAKIIRGRMRSGKEWKDRVPKGAVREIARRENKIRGIRGRR